MRAVYVFFFSSRRRHTRSLCDWSSDVCSSDLANEGGTFGRSHVLDTIRNQGGGLAGIASVAVADEKIGERRKILGDVAARSEERRVGKECKCRWAQRCYNTKKRDHNKKTEANA